METWYRKAQSKLSIKRFRNLQDKLTKEMKSKKKIPVTNISMTAAQREFYFLSPYLVALAVGHLEAVIYEQEKAERVSEQTIGLIKEFLGIKKKRT